MASDPPKRRTGGSKKFQDASDELRYYNELRRTVTRMSDMLDKQDQALSSFRELVTRANALLDKQMQRLTGRVEESVEPSTPPARTTGARPPAMPPLPALPDVPEDAPTTRPSMKPTVMHQAAMTPTAFYEIVRKRFDDASGEHDRDLARELLRKGMENQRDFADDPALQELARELRDR